MSELITIHDFIVNIGTVGISNGGGDFSEIPELRGYFEPDKPEEIKQLTTEGINPIGESFEYLKLSFGLGWSQEAHGLVENVKFIPYMELSGSVYLVADLFEHYKTLESYRLVRWEKHIESKNDNLTVVQDILFFVDGGNIENPILKAKWPWIKTN